MVGPHAVSCRNADNYSQGHYPSEVLNLHNANSLPYSRLLWPVAICIVEGCAP
jgi:hypothetical protein